MTVNGSFRDASTPASSERPPEFLIIALVSICNFTSILSTTMFNVVLPEIGRDFQASPATLGWLFTAYSLVFGISTTFYGRLGDLYGIRRFLIIGIMIFSGGALLAAIAPNFATLIVARVIQAIGGAAIPALGTATLFRIVPAHRRGIAMGYMSAVLGSGAGLGPVIGGALADFVSWRALFLIPGALVIMIPVLLRLLPPLDGTGRGSLDILGGALLGFSLASLLIAVTNIERAGIASIEVLIPFLLFVPGIVLLIYRVRSRDDAFVPKILLHNRNFVLLAVAAGFMMMAAMGTMIVLPLMLDEVQGIRVGQIGLVLLPSAALSAVLGPIGGKLADRFGSRVPLRIAMGSLAVGTIVISTFGASGTAWQVALLTVFIGAGMGLGPAAILNGVSMVLPSSQGGMGIGLVHLFFLVGGSFGVTIMTAILDARFAITQSINIFHSGSGAAFADTMLYATLAASAAFTLSLLVRIPRASSTPVNATSPTESRTSESAS